jgi:hypothetical protein
MSAGTGRHLVQLSRDMNGAGDEYMPQDTGYSVSTVTGCGILLGIVITDGCYLSTCSADILFLRLWPAACSIGFCAETGSHGKGCSQHRLCLGRYPHPSDRRVRVERP